MTNLSDVVLLLADTVRSRAYVDALRHAGFRFDRALVVRTPAGSRWGQASEVEMGNTDFGELFVPDVNGDLERGCRAVCGGIDIMDTGSINAPEIVDALSELAPRLVVFSGFGGELVHSEVLNAAGPLLHLHAGWLPDYRGSTTLYYSYLVDGTMGASAILLSEEIDAGAVVRRKRYPAPPPGTNVDYVYDSVLRADLLIETLSSYDPGTSRFMSTESVDPERGARDYYIVHPLLKHIALNELDCR